jgi:hypothetical protein
MTEEVDADPAQLTNYAAQLLTTTDTFTDGLTSAAGDFPVTAAVFGNADGAQTLFDRHANAAEAAENATTCAVEILERDVEQLYQVAFAYRVTDIESGDDIRRPGPN